jgi:hypothetical protein
MGGGVTSSRYMAKATREVARQSCDHNVEYGIRVNSIHPYAVKTPMSGFEGMSDILV